MKHTALPWHLPHADSPYWQQFKLGGRTIPIADASGRVVCRVESIPKECETNAHLIVQACNDYGALKAELEAAYQILAACDSLDWLVDKGPEGEGWPSNELSAVRILTGKARDSLAKAGDDA